MTTITRINTTYGSGGGAYHGHGNVQRQKSDHISIWGESSFNRSNYDYIGANNGVENVSYARPGASFVPMNQVMTAPFGANADLLGMGRDNPFAMSSFNTTSIFSNFMRGFGRNNNFLSLTGQHSDHHSGHSNNNIFRNNHVNSHGLRLKTTSTRTGNFGSQTTSNRSTSIHTPSVDFNTRDIKSGNSSISKTNISGHVDSYKQTNQHIVTPTSDLNKTRQVVYTPTEKITRNVTKGTIWV